MTDGAGEYIAILGVRFWHVIHVYIDDDEGEIMERVPERFTTMEEARHRAHILNGQPKAPDLKERVEQVRSKRKVVPHQQTLDHQERAAGGDD